MASECNYPPEIVQAYPSGRWTAVTDGESEAQVARVTHDGHARAFVKSAPIASEIQAEAERLRWLQGRLPVPALLADVQGSTHRYLLLSAIPGLMAHDPAFRADLPGLMQTLAAGLRRIHALPIADCPFDERLAVKIPRARESFERGLVDSADFDNQRNGMTATDLFASFSALLRPPEDLVFTHGDYCLPNILLDPTTRQINGFIDWARAGIADRYQDLSIAARTIAHNHGAEWVVPFFAAYGIDVPDQEKIAYYQFLDEFF